MPSKFFVGNSPLLRTQVLSREVERKKEGTPKQCNPKECNGAPSAGIWDLPSLRTRYVLKSLHIVVALWGYVTKAYRYDAYLPK
jgi:hypothetical protein